METVIIIVAVVLLVGTAISFIVKGIAIRKSREGAFKEEVKREDIFSALQFSINHAKHYLSKKEELRPFAMGLTNAGSKSKHFNFENSDVSEDDVTTWIKQQHDPSLDFALVITNDSQSSRLLIRSMMRGAPKSELVALPYTFGDEGCDVGSSMDKIGSDVNLLK